MASEDLSVRAIVGAALGAPDGRGSRPEAPPPFDGRGILEDLGSAVAAAAGAFAEIGGVTLERRGAMIAAMRRTVLENVERLSRMAVDETGLGRVEDKVRKNTLAAARTPGLEDLEPIAHSGDRGLTLVERAPYGVIGSITPCTNPTETVVNNAISMVAAGNSVVFSPHPSARVVTLTVIDLLNRAIAEAGGPRALLFSVSEPSVAAARELMAHPRIRLLVVTGGPAVVRAAMQSGKKVIGAGPGNPPVVVDETADLDGAARDIVAGASLDNNIVCIAEKEIIAVRKVAAQLRAALVGAGAVELRGQAVERLTRLVVKKDAGPGKPSELDRRFVGKDAAVIMGEAGLPCPPGARLAFFETDRTHPLFWTEQMMPVLPLVTVEDAAEAIALAKEVEGGCLHTAVMHSRNIANLSAMAKTMNVTIFVKNGPSYAGLGFGGEGHTSFTIAGPTGEGLTSARTFTRERRCTLVDHFRIV